MSSTDGPERGRGVYGISVAAELVGMGVQNLRAYEARGLLEPERTDGGTRRYSADDLDRLRRIGDLLDAGLNLLDTAECYADSETKVGQAVSHRRGDFFLFTKVGHAARFRIRSRPRRSQAH